MESDKCVRLYDKEGKHRLTLLQCVYNSERMDIATPEGLVLVCDDGEDPFIETKLVSGLNDMVEPIDHEVCERKGQMYYMADEGQQSIIRQDCKVQFLKDGGITLSYFEFGEGKSWRGTRKSGTYKLYEVKRPNNFATLCWDAELKTLVGRWSEDCTRGYWHILLK